MAEHELDGWAELGRTVTDDDRVRHTPPPLVWEDIAASIAGDETQIVAPDENDPEVVSDEVVPPEAVVDLNAERQHRAPAEIRRKRRNLLLAGAASVLVFLIGLSLLTGIGNEPDITTFVADVNNAELPEEFEGTATAIVAIDDAPMLEIEFSGDLPNNDPVEVWLFNADLTEMRSLGIVPPDASEWSADWPSDLDPAEYATVDLSIEPANGDPAHSGRSILRGQLILS